METGFGLREGARRPRLSDFRCCMLNFFRLTISICTQAHHQEQWYAHDEKKKLLFATASNSNTPPRPARSDGRIEETRPTRRG